MKKKGYFSFIKWYFNYIGNKLFDNYSPKHNRYHIRRKDRLTLVVLAYVVMLLAMLSIFFHILEYYISILLIISSIIFLWSCQFSFTYYYLVYNRYVNQSISVNDKVIVDECVLFYFSKDIRRIISHYFKIVDIKGNIFVLKYYLIDKSKKYTKLYRKDLHVLKITTNKIYFDGEKVFSKKLSDILDLADFLDERASN